MTARTALAAVWRGILPSLLLVAFAAASSTSRPPGGLEAIPELVYVCYALFTAYTVVHDVSWLAAVVAAALPAALVVSGLTFGPPAPIPMFLAPFAPFATAYACARLVEGYGGEFAQFAFGAGGFGVGAIIGWAGYQAGPSLAGVLTLACLLLLPFTRTFSAKAAV